MAFFLDDPGNRILPGGVAQFSGFFTTGEITNQVFIGVELPWRPSGSWGILQSAGGHITNYSAPFTPPVGTAGFTAYLCGADQEADDGSFLGKEYLNFFAISSIPEVHTSGSVITERRNNIWTLNVGLALKTGGALDLNNNRFAVDGWVRREVLPTDED